MQGLSIGEVAAQTGLQTSAIRYYEQMGLIPKPQRHNTRRRYDPSVLQWISLINLARKAGFSIAEVQTLMHGFEADTPPSERWQTMAHSKLIQVAQQMQVLQQMQALLTYGMQCQCLRLEDCRISDEQGCNEGCSGATQNEGCE